MPRATARHESERDAPPRVQFVPILVALTLCVSTRSIAQTLESAPPSVSAEPQQVTTETPSYPWNDRPKCASMFLRADWRLTPRQRTCNWVNNGLLSTSRVFSTVGSTAFSMISDRPSERGDGFRVRFGRKWLQGAMATTGQYLGGEIAREDPRGHPPYLALRNQPRPHGFFKRFGAAITRNVIATRCSRSKEIATDPNDIGQCLEAKDIHNTFRLSRVLGSVASGGGGALLNGDRSDRAKRAWNGMASAYVTSFAAEVFSEFKPELTAVLGGLLRRLGVR